MGLTAFGDPVFQVVVPSKFHEEVLRTSHDQLGLTDLLKVRAKCIWSGSCQQAFDNVRTFLCSPPVLMAPCMNHPFALQVDASDVGAGAVLFQGDSDGDECPAFETIIQKLVTAPVLAFADPCKAYLLHTDANSTGLIAVLYQEQEGKNRVIAYASRGLSHSEYRYPAHKQSIHVSNRQQPSHLPSDSQTGCNWL